MTVGLARGVPRRVATYLRTKNKIVALTRRESSPLSRALVLSSRSLW